MSPEHVLEDPFWLLIKQTKQRVHLREDSDWNHGSSVEAVKGRDDDEPAKLVTRRSLRKSPGCALSWKSSEGSISWGAKLLAFAFFSTMFFLLYFSTSYTCIHLIRLRLNKFSAS